MFSINQHSSHPSKEKEVCEEYFNVSSSKNGYFFSKKEIPENSPCSSSSKAKKISVKFNAWEKPLNFCPPPLTQGKINQKKIKVPEHKNLVFFSSQLKATSKKNNWNQWLETKGLPHLQRHFGCENLSEAPVRGKEKETFVALPFNDFLDEIDRLLGQILSENLHSKVTYPKFIYSKVSIPKEKTPLAALFRNGKMNPTLGHAHSITCSARINGPNEKPIIDNIYPSDLHFSKKCKILTHTSFRSDQKKFV